MAPLDWGLGHATRCIPIIRGLVNAGFEVVLAAEGSQAALLQTEFPLLPILPLEGYRVKYSKHPRWFAFSLLKQLPRLFNVIRKENRFLQQLITKNKFDLVISDNRYGLYHPSVPCIFITHQLNIQAGFAWLEKCIQWINYRYINRFIACWVPDIQGEKSIAGALSNPAKLPAIPVHYMGLLSRFQPQEEEIVYEYCILLSGPEPQRTVLENILISQIDSLQGKILMVRGKPGSQTINKLSDHVEVKNHLPGESLHKALSQSRYIISRSGYTTVMELVTLQKKAILIPTPGQTEQEYLAKKLMEQGYCFSIEQADLNLAEQIKLAKEFAFKNAECQVFDPETIMDLLKASV